MTEKLHPSTLARQQRITEAERLLAEGVPIAEVAVTLGYASVNSLQSTLRNRRTDRSTGPRSEAPARPAGVAAELALVTAEAARLEEAAQQALWRGRRGEYAELIARAAKLYAEKRRLWALRRTEGRELVLNTTETTGQHSWYWSAA